jgi:hypothetical protein
MSYAYALAPGGVLAKIRAAIHATVAGIDDLTANPGKDAPVRVEDQAPPPDPYADQTKWPAWKVTLAVIIFCGAFWTGIGYLVLRIF